MIRSIDLKRKAQLHMYLPITICIPEYQEFTVHALLDSGAEASLLQEIFIPQQFWVPLDKKGMLNDFMERQVFVTHKAKNLQVQISDIHGNNKIYNFDFALLPKEFDSDCILGMDNLRHLPPFNKYYSELDGSLVPQVTLPATIAPHYTPAAQRGEKPVTLIEHVKTPKIIQPKICTYNIPTTNEFEILIHNMLEPLYSDDPLKWFDKAPRYCKIELMEQYKDAKVRVNSIMVSPTGKEKLQNK